MQKNSPTRPAKETEKLLPETIRSEVNLLVLPFFALWSKDNKHRTEIEYKTTMERNNKKLEVSWTVTSNSKYGYPGPFDRSVHKAIEQIICELPLPIKNPIQIGSIYSLIDKMGLKTKGGQVYKKVKEALQRITLTGIVSKGIFYDKQEEQWVEDTFHLYERIVFKGKKLPDGTIADTNLIYLNNWYLDNINARYVKPIDWKYYRSLETPIAQRLYEILSVKFYGVIARGDGCVSYRYSTLCDLLPVTKQNYLSLAMRIMEPAHEKLKKTGFLGDYKWEKSSSNDDDSDWIILYYPGRRAREEVIRFSDAVTPEPELPSPCEENLMNSELIVEDDTITQLIQRGITMSVAKNLISCSSPEQIQKQIEVFDFLVGIKSPLVKKNPAGFLRKSIEENYQPPEEYFSYLEKRSQRLEAERTIAQRQVEEEEKEKGLSKIRVYKESLSQEEKAKLREEAELEIRSSGQYNEKFITDYLIQAKENEIVARRLGIELPE